ncbi:hypothetical protein ASPWEDRAFT_24838 [Aspergillus wentii DTO 134E9]|uniref:Ubiquitin-like domain-containing protein n=1 Tax=Aspergillus wentii DTO 134E9 TaxID=1073089 RepID=A0A1L9RVS6_ASPWE|nr:uncharacterized protein ASPWEDRAFT_24838 [Aspergillus wentii DTO 134E9]KAI9928863.1 hypothetical protein MW887_002086 [Aspergillus wentii]OJJ38967.1 hypothetical protein ASPWEDRAFT_24838 [Aspergillus wentii DTO 134E9]
MGCCFSLLSRDTNHASYATGTLPEGSPPGIHTTTSAIVTSHPSTSLANAPSPVVRSASHRQPQPRLPLGEHYNAPIRPHVWYSKRRLWTRAQLDQERREFFETRVTGKSEVWVALQAAISFIWTSDIETAQSIIDAAGVTVPTGDLCQGCYDEQGVLYRLPQCIVSDPENIAQGDTADDIDDGKLAPDETSGDELISSELEQRKEEKGKTSERDLIKVKARLSDRDGPDIIVSVGKTQNVGYIARKIQQEAGISRPRRVRIAYLGRLLKEQKTLPDQGWNPNHVVNALVTTRSSLS